MKQRVLWQGTGDKYLEPSHGLEFVNGSVSPAAEYRDSRYAAYTLETYVRHLIYANRDALRVWVDNVEIWCYEHGFHDKKWEERVGRL
jgi:hypothetical protein